MSSSSASVGRNDPCPCGSGQKYKRCCGQVGARAETVGPHPGEIDAAVGLLNAGHLAQAESHVRALLARYENSGILWKILSVAMLRQGRDALVACRTAATLLPGDAEAQHNLGIELGERRQWSEAVEPLRRAVAAGPRNADYLVDLADALREAGRAAESLDLYRRALAIDARHVEAQNNLGNAYMELRQPEEALGCYRVALGLRPNHPQILCNLSNAQRQHGLLDEALASARSAAALDPRSAAACTYAGLALQALGRPDEALATYRQALAINPREVAALTSMAQALRELGRHREALELCRTAVGIDPAYADGHCNLGNAQFDLRLIDEAGASYREALRLQPRHVAASTGLALVLRQQRKPAEAQAACHAALAIDPKCVEALSLLGELEADAGRFSDAEAIFRRAIDVNPRFAFAYANIAAHRRMTLEDQQWQRGAQALLDGRLPVDQRVSLHFALGKYFDDTRQYDEAFAQYAQGNRLTSALRPPYDPMRVSSRVDRVIRDCDATFARACEAMASRSDLPLFVIGMPRSGTSLAEQILASHGSVYGAGEVAFWDSAFDEGHRKDEPDRADPGLMCELGKTYVQRIRAMAPTALRIVDKMPANFLYAGLIHAVLPGARIIHMRRNAVDTCLSIYFQNFFTLGQYTNDLQALVHYYRQYTRVTDHWRATLPSTAFLEVPYEDLTTDQESWTRRIIDFAGLPWDASCLNFEQTDRTVITASKWQVRQKMTAGSAGRWRHYEKHLGPLRELLVE